MNNHKYKIEDGRLVEKANGVPIPLDEPVFILRASDRKALAAVVAYSMIVNGLDHKAAVVRCIVDFREFERKNPDKMREA